MATAPERKLIWLDCDTGHDDAFALLLAAHHSSSKLLGVSTVHGNASLDHTTFNTRAVLEAIGGSHVPVIRGSDRPLKRHASFAPDIHGESGLDGVTLLPKPTCPLDSRPIEDVARILLSQPPGKAHLVATGPLTNVAKIVASAPQLVQHLAGLSIMGGAVGGGFTDAPLGKVAGQGERFGNWSPWAEFNIYADPEAAHKIFSNEELATKTTLISLDLTHQVRGTESVQRKLFGDGSANKLPVLRRLMREILLFFSETYASQFAITDGPPLHDPLAVWAALCPEMFDDACQERWRIDIDITPGHYQCMRDPNNHVGQTVLTKASNGQGVRVPRKVDVDRFWQVIDAAMQAAVATSS